MSELSWEGKGATKMLPIGPEISRIPSLDLAPWAMYQPDVLTEQTGQAPHPPTLSEWGSARHRLKFETSI